MKETQTLYQKIIVLGLVIALFLLIGQVRQNPVLADLPRTPKACHQCETVLPEPTKAPQVDACAVDCLDDDSRLETMPEVTLGSGELWIDFYWMEGCPHCEEIKNTVLPEILGIYQTEITIRQIEVKTLDDVDQLYTLGLAYGLPKEKIGVPLILIGDRVLTGEDNVSRDLPRLIQSTLRGDPSNGEDTAFSSRSVLILAGVVLGSSTLLVMIFFLISKRKK